MNNTTLFNFNAGGGAASLFTSLLLTGTRKRMPPSTKRQPKKGNGCLNFTVLLLTATPLALLFVTVNYGPRLHFISPTAPNGVPQDTTPDVDAQRALRASLATSLFNQKTQESVNQATEDLRRGGESAWDITANKSTGSVEGNFAPPTSAHSNFAAKRAFIASEPVDGDWLLDCPFEPPRGYPKAYPIMDLINNWPPDHPEPPPRHYHSLCRLVFFFFVPS